MLEVNSGDSKRISA